MTTEDRYRDPTYVNPFNCSLCQNRIGNLVTHTIDDFKEIYDLLKSKDTGMMCMPCSQKYSLEQGYYRIPDDLK